jgi:hypothetical protein
MEHLVSEPERRHVLARLVRGVSRGEQVAIEHAALEARRLGEDAPPAVALRAIAEHAAAMRSRFTAIISGYGVPAARAGLGAALATLRDLVVDRIVHGERAYRIVLLDLRNSVDTVRLLREAARAHELLGLIRWCDDWMSVRRPLLAHAERELAWFSEAPALTGGAPHADERHGEPPLHDGGPPTSNNRPSSHDHR